jgi:hypothetical protein
MDKIDTLSGLEGLLEKIQGYWELQRETSPPVKSFFGIEYVSESTSRRCERFDECLKRSDLPVKIKVTPQIASYLAYDDHEYYEQAETAFNTELKSWGKLWFNTWATVIMSPHSIPSAVKNIADIRSCRKEYARHHENRDKVCREILGEYELCKEGGSYYLNLSFHPYLTSNYGWIPKSRGGVNPSVKLDELPPLPPR